MVKVLEAPSSIGRKREQSACQEKNRQGTTGSRKFSEKVAKKLELLKAPRENCSDVNVHYDLLDVKHLPKIYHGYLVQVNIFNNSKTKKLSVLIFSSVNILNIV